MQKFGIIGMGIRGKMYADIIRQNPDAQLMAICDTNEVILEEYSKTWGIAVFKDSLKLKWNIQSSFSPFHNSIHRA